MFNEGQERDRALRHVANVHSVTSQDTIRELARLLVHLRAHCSIEDYCDECRRAEIWADLIEAALV